MSLQQGGGREMPDVTIQNHDEDLYHLSLVQVCNGGSVHGFGMGRPLLEIIEEGKARPVRNSVIASIAACPSEQLATERQANFTNSLDFITPQGIVGSGLALIALSRSVERSVHRGHIEHQIPTWQRLRDLSLSIVAVDKEVRQQAYANPAYMPDETTKLELIPPKIPSHPNDTVDVGLYVDQENRMSIIPTAASIEIGKIKFEKRELSGHRDLPIDEIFRRSDWEIESAPYSGYLLQIMTGSVVSEIDTEEALPSNVRNISASYGIGT